MKEFTIKYRGIPACTVKQDFEKAGKMVKFEASFPKGQTLDNPFLAGIILSKCEFIVGEENKKELEKFKCLPQFKNSIPLDDILYELTGGATLWESSEVGKSWNSEVAEKLFGKDVQECLEECISLYDLIVAYRWLQEEFILPRIGELFEKL